MYFLTSGHKKNSRISSCFSHFSYILCTDRKLQFMIQYMKSRSLLDMTLQIIQKIRVKRDHFAALPAYEMVMLCFVSSSSR